MIYIFNTQLFYNKTFFISIFLSIILIFNIFIFLDIYTSPKIELFFLGEIHVFPENISLIIKNIYIISIFISWLFILNIAYNKLIKEVPHSISQEKTSNRIENSLIIGKEIENQKIISIPEKGLYQNMLITGTIGTGKTSSAMYPFTKQLLDMNMGMLILDVKGNFHIKVKEFAENLQRNVIVLELRWEIYI